jgi:hypothetical protein
MGLATAIIASLNTNLEKTTVEQRTLSYTAITFYLETSIDPIWAIVIFLVPETFLLWGFH